MLFSLDFGILDVKAGREQLRALIERGKTVPIVLTGVIHGVWSRDDGFSREFQLKVVDAKPIERLEISVDTPFARVEDVEPGDVLVADDGLICLKEGEMRIVYHDEAGLHIQCKGKAGLDGDPSGRHYLDGARSDLTRKLPPGEPVRYVGLWRLKDLLKVQHDMIEAELARLDEQLAAAKDDNLDRIRHDIPRRRRKPLVSEVPTAEPRWRPAKLSPKVKAIVEDGKARGFCTD